MKLIKRTMEAVLRERAKRYPVVTITGPRQSGKTTLCRKVFPNKPYVSLENMDARQYAQEDPHGFLASLPDGALLDEIQRAPDLLSYMQTLVDQDGRKGLFILTGSQQMEVATTINQSLAGRTALLKLLPFSLEELGAQGRRASLDRLLVTGFYPRIWHDGLAPAQALASYIETYVERDIRQLVAVKDLALFQRFVSLCAGRVGGLLNLNSLAADCGISHQSARNWFTLLEASYIVFRLPPYFANIKKRLVKSPRLYFYDVGLASSLLGLETEAHASSHPLRGNLFENMVVMEALKHRLHRGQRSNLHFYRDSNGNEVDLLLTQGGGLFPMEIKSGQTLNPDYFKGLQNFAALFPLPQGAALIYAGAQRQDRHAIKARPYTALPTLLAKAAHPTEGVQSPEKI